MRIVITGATGAVGRRLVPALLARNERVAVITRRPRDARRLFGGDVEVIAGNCSIPGPWQQSIDGAQAVIHLAGHPIGEKRWNRVQRELIESSRVESTHHMVNAIEEARSRPSVFVSSSGTSYYGDVGFEDAHEKFPPGKGFLADVCVRWEAEAVKAAGFGVRVVRARFGIVIDEHSVALRLLLPWFRSGLGATFGSGRQRLPWIWHGDCVRSLLHCLDRASIEGPVNITAPKPCSQREFARALGRAVGRPALLRVPWIALRIAYGPFADEFVRSQGAVPRVLLADGFTFDAGAIDDCMKELLREEDEARVASKNAPAAGAARPRADVATSLPKPTRPPARPRLLVVSSVLVEQDGLPRNGVREAVRTASSRGCAVVIAGEARGPALGPLLVDPLLHPLAIAANGAVLWNHRDGRAAFSDRIEQVTVAALTLALRRAVPEATIVFEGEDWIASDKEEIEGFGRADLRLQVGELPPRPTVRMHVVATPDQVARARSAIEGPFWRERKVTLFSRGATVLTIAAPLVDRAVAAQRIARKMGASRDETMALVAEESDLGLADWCGFSIASPDAPAGVRRIASAVMPPSHDPLGDTVKTHLAAP